MEWGNSSASYLLLIDPVDSLNSTLLSNPTTSVGPFIPSLYAIESGVDRIKKDAMSAGFTAYCTLVSMSVEGLCMRPTCSTPTFPLTKMRLL